MSRRPSRRTFEKHLLPRHKDPLQHCYVIRTSHCIVADIPKDIPTDFDNNKNSQTHNLLLNKYFDTNTGKINEPYMEFKKNKKSGRPRRKSVVAPQWRMSRRMSRRTSSESHGCAVSAADIRIRPSNA